MDDQRPITVDLDDAERAQLHALAEHEEQSAEHVAADAVRARLARHEAYLRAIDEGLAAAAEGRTFSDEEVREEFRAMRAKFLSDRSS